MATLRSQSSAKQPVKVAGTCSREAEFQAAPDRFTADYAGYYAGYQKHRAAAVDGRLGPVRGTRRDGAAGYTMWWLAIQETTLPTLLCLGGILIGLIA
jgi:hypothetical protein